MLQSGHKQNRGKMYGWDNLNSYRIWRLLKPWRCRLLALFASLNGSFVEVNLMDFKNFKNMKNYTVLFFIILLACAKEDTIISDRPPFDEFWLSTRFDYTRGSSGFSNLKYYNVWGKMRNEPVTGGGYWYYLSNTSTENPKGSGQLPAGGSLKVTARQNNIITIEGSGTLPRQGNKLPNLYTGDEALWMPTQCDYRIIVEADTDTKQILKVSFELANGKFVTKQDITNAMEFHVLTSSNTWVISSIAPMVIANGNITFTFDLL